MSIAVPVGPSRSGTHSRPIARVAQTALAVIGLTFLAAFIAVTRTFGFEYFHGDHTAMQALVHVIFGP